MSAAPVSVTVLAEWVFEGPDPEVGIFGDSIIHLCPENLEDTQDAVTLSTRLFDEIHTDTVAIVTTFECPVCAATTTTTDTQPRAYFEEPRP